MQMVRDWTRGGWSEVDCIVREKTENEFRWRLLIIFIYVQLFCACFVNLGWHVMGTFTQTMLEFGPSSNFDGLIRGSAA